MIKYNVLNILKFPCPSGGNDGVDESEALVILPAPAPAAVVVVTFVKVIRFFFCFFFEPLPVAYSALDVRGTVVA